MVIPKMKGKVIKQWLAMFLSLLMVLSNLSVEQVFAAGATARETISKTYILAPDTDEFEVTETGSIVTDSKAGTDNYFTIKNTGGKLSVTAGESAREFTVEDTTLSLMNKIGTGGAGSDTDKSIWITISPGATADITVCADSSNTNNIYLGLYNSTTTGTSKLANAVKSELVTAGSENVVTWTGISEGTYYMCGTKDGEAQGNVVFYYISVTENSEVEDPVEDEDPAEEGNTYHYSDLTWKATAFGNNTGSAIMPSYNSSNKVISVEASSSIGKITDSGHDGIVYYYTSVDADKNFVLTADVTVDYYTTWKTDGTLDAQVGFGLMVRDKINTGTDYAFSNAASVGAYYGRYNVFGRYGVTADVTTDTLGKTVPRFCQYGKPTENTGDFQVEENAPKTFKMTIGKDDTGIWAQMLDENGADLLADSELLDGGNVYIEDSKSRVDLPSNTFTTLDSDKIYVGFMAARGAKIEVDAESIELTVTPAAIMPELSLTSALTADESSYTLAFDVNVAGILTVELNGKTETKEVTEAGTVEVPVTLQPGENAVKVTFTPDSSQNLTDGEAIEQEYTITYSLKDAPVLTISSKEVADGAEVTISCDVEGADIYYTTDGTDPTVGSTKYTEPFSLTETATVKAIAVAEGYAQGSAEEEITVGEAAKDKTYILDPGKMEDLSNSNEDISAGTENYFTIKSKGTVSIAGANKTFTVGDTQVVTTKSIRFGAPGSKEDRSIAFTIAEGTTADIVVCTTTASANANGRVCLLDSEGNIVDGTSSLVQTNTANVAVWNNIPAGAYYIAGHQTEDASGNPNVHYVSVTQKLEEESVEDPEVTEHVFDATEIDATDKTNGVSITGSTFADGYFTVSGTVTQIIKENATTSIRLGKASTGNMSFTITGTADVEIVAASTGSSNESTIALVDSTGKSIANNEEITIVAGAGGTTLTYSGLTEGTYQIVSPKDSSRDRGVEIISVKVTEPAAAKVTIETEDAEDSVKVTLSSVEGAAIYYTTDGSEPTVDSEEYTEPFTLTETATVKAIAVADGYRQGEAEKEVLVLPTADIAIEAEETEDAVEVTISSTTEGAKIYYTTDGSEPAEEDSREYTEKIVLTEEGTTTIKAIAVADDYKNGSAEKEVTVKPVAEVTIEQEETDEGIKVTVSSTTEGATIYYTLDGTDPTKESDEYTDTIEITEAGTTTVKAIAVAEGYRNGKAEEVVTVQPAVKVTISTSEEADGSVTVTITSDPADATIYYTTNGDDPADSETERTEYDGPFTVTKSTIVKAIAVAENYKDGSAEERITIGSAADVEISEKGVTDGVEVTIETIEAIEDAKIYYTTDGSDPTDSESREEYTKPFVVSEEGTTTIKAVAVADGYTQSVAEREVVVLAAPEITIRSEIIDGNVTVTITSSVEGASIYYTTDGETPTEASTAYTKEFVLTANATVKALVTANGHKNAVAEEEVTATKAKVTITETEVEGGVEVTLSSETPNAKIYYTIDGSEPSLDSTEYTAPFTLTETATIKVFVTAEGYLPVRDEKEITIEESAKDKTYILNPSELSVGSIATASTAGTDNYFTFNNSSAKMSVSAIVDGPREFTVGDAVLSFTNQIGTGGAGSAGDKSIGITISEGEIADITVCTDSSNVNNIYLCLFNAGGAEVERTLVTAGEENVITWLDIPAGSYYMYGVKDNAAGYTGNVVFYYVSVTEKSEEAPVIELSISSEMLDGKDEAEVTISGDVEDAEIYYTTDGTVPTTNSTKYTEPFTLTETTTVKAIAIAGGYRHGSAEEEVRVLLTADIAINAEETEEGIKVTISSTTEGATIYYTLDGTDPTTSSDEYTDTIEITEAGTTTVKAIAVAEGYRNGKAEEVVTVQPAVKVTISTSEEADGSVTVTITSDPADATIYYTTNGDDPADSETERTEYDGPFTVTRSTHVKAIAVAENYKDGSAEERITIGSAADVEISEKGVTDGVEVTIETIEEIEDAKIYYTTDGSDPTDSESREEYTGPFVVSDEGTTKIMAVAVADGYTQSVAERDVVVLAAPEVTIESEIIDGNVTVTITSSVEGAAIYYTTDGETPTEASTAYTKEFVLTANATVKALVTAAGHKNATREADIIATKAKVTITETEVEGGVEVTLSSETPDAKIYYTTGEGEASLDSEPYTAPFTLTETATVKVFVTAEGYLPVRDEKTITVLESEGEVHIFNPAEIEVAEDLDLNASDYKNPVIASGTTYADGYFTVTGTVNQIIDKENRVTKTIRLEKASQGSMSFTITGTADVKIVAASTGSSNESAIALVDSTGKTIANNEEITIVAGIDGMTLTYSGLTAGTYKIVSPKDSARDRGVEILSVKVVEELAEAELTIETEDAEGGVRVTLSSVEGAAIYYTTDGSEPSVDSTLYEGPFTLTETATVKAIAVAEGYRHGSLSQEVKVEIEAQKPVAEVTITTKTIETGVEVTLASTAANAKIYYTTNGDEPTESSNLYTAPFTLTETAKVKVLVVAEGYENGTKEEEITVVLVEDPEITEHVFNAAVIKVAEDLDVNASDYANPVIASGTTYADGYFTVTGTVYQIIDKENRVTKTIRLEKQSKGSMSFTITGTADVEIVAASTGSSNESAIALVDSTGKTIANNEGITIVAGTDGTTLTYSGLTAGTYKIVSPTDPARGRGVEIISVKVTEPAAAKVTIATANVADGVRVTLSSVAGAAIYYTTDGSEPSVDSTLYEGPFTLTETATVKAIAIAEGYRHGSLAQEVKVEVAVPKPVADVTITTKEAEGGVEVTITSTAENAKIYYTTDGSEPTEASKVYTGTFVLSETATVKALVVAEGYENGTAERVVNVEVIVPKPVADVTITTKEVETGVEVTIASSAENAKIYYTTDGSEPTEASKVYTGTFVLSETATVKVLVVAEGYENGTAVQEVTVETIVQKPAADVTITTREVEAGVEVTITSTAANAKIYYTTDGSEPTENSTEYKGAFVLSETATVKVLVVAEGYENGTAEREVKVEVVVPKPVADVTITTKEVEGGVEVTIASTAANAKIYYTTDGSEPTEGSTEYKGAFVLTETATVKVLVVAEGYENGTAVQEVTVVVTPDPEEPGTGFVPVEGGEWAIVGPDGEVDTTATGFVEYDGEWFYVSEGYLDQEGNGFMEYDGEEFYVAGGQLQKNANGLVEDNGKWYYVAEGQKQSKYSGLAEYDGGWFVLVNGVLDSTYTGFYNYDGETFLIAEGRLVSEYSGLYLAENGLWYLIAEGRIIRDYVGLVIYNGAWFYVANGVLAVEFSGWVDYDGSKFYVANGMVQP